MNNFNTKRGSILIYVLIASVILATIGGVASYVTNQILLTNRRANVEKAFQYADGGASIVADDLNRAFTASPNNVASGLTSDGSFPYTLSNELSTADEKCYTRTIAAPFVSQTVDAQVWLDANDDYVGRIVTAATTGGVTQSVSMNVEMSYGFGAAVISTAPGDSSTEAKKSSAQAGNVAIEVSMSDTTYIAGGVIANGTVNYDGNFATPSIPITESVYGTEDEIPNYTDAGSADQLFDFERFIALADVMGTHYANTTDFTNAVLAAGTSPLQGVIVVDIEDGVKEWKTDTFTNGINIEGTLIFNFDSDWEETDKLKIKCPLNVNPADLSGLVYDDPDTYPSGYPVSLPDTKTAHKVDISGMQDSDGNYFSNFSASDDLPAIMYRTAIADFHGDMNVSGVVYSPVFAEIENKEDGQLQYINGSVIGGGGILYQNKKNAISIINYDPATLDRLATAGSNGKEFNVVARN